MGMCKLRTIILLVLSVFFYGHVNGLSVQYKKYLPGHDVKCLTIDKSNRLWVGSSNGFYIFNNSYQLFYSSYNKNNHDNPFIDVSLIEPFDNGALFSTQDKLYQFNISLNEFNEVKLNGSSASPDAACRLDSYIYLFYGSENVLVRYSIDSGIIEPVFQFNDDNHYRFEKIVSVESDHNLLILADNENGLFEFNITSGQIRKVDIHSEEIKASTLCGIGDSLYVATLNDGLYCLSVSGGYKLTGRIYNDGTANGLANNDINACCIDPFKNRMYICVENVGVYVYELSDKTFYKLLESQELLSVPLICNVGYDNIICVSPGNGILNLKASFFKTFMKGSRERNISLSGSMVLSILPDKSDGGIWLGTDGGGINKLFIKSNYDDDFVYEYPLTGTEKISSMAECGSNSLLCLIKRKGFFLFNKKTGTLKPFSFSFVSNIDLIKQPYKNMMISQCGNSDIFVFNVNNDNYYYNTSTGHYESFTLIPEGKDDYVVKSYTNQYHTLIQTNYSIYEINNHTFRVRRLYNSDVLIGASASCIDGSIFFTENNKIFRFNPSNSELQEFFELPDNNVFISSLCRDNSGVLWMTLSNNDVSYFNKEENMYVSYPASLFADNHYTNYFSTLIQNRVYVSGTTGMLMIDPDDIASYGNVSNVSVSLRNISVNGVFVPINADRIVVPSVNSNVTFNLDVSNGDPFRADMLKYSLISVKGVRQKVVYELIDNKTSVTFNSLMPGNYILDISSRNYLGWQNSDTIFKFKVQRPFLSSIYAFLLYFLLVVCFIFVLILFAQRNKRARLEQARFQFTQERNDNKMESMVRIVHDLRSPLFIVMNRINSALVALKDKKSDYDKLSAALSQVDKMTQMINTVLSQARDDISDFQLVTQKINVNDWASQMVSNFQDRAESCGLTLNFVADLSLKRINADVRLLESCLRNLLTNAIKYSDSGTIVVQTKRYEGKCRISVIDQGRGFTCTSDELFSKYFRESKEENKAQGFGIGLSSVKDFSERMGGSAGAEHNASGIGSTFWFEVPMFDENEAPAPVLFNFDTSKYSILVVDDNSDVTDYFKMEFRYLFKKVLTADNVGSAMEIIGKYRPDFVISDVLMANTDGVELCSLIKKNLATSHIPVALFSSNLDVVSSLSDLNKTGPDLIFSMPFDSQKVFQSVKDMLIERVRLRDKYLLGHLKNLSTECIYSVADERFVAEFNSFCSRHSENSIKQLSFFAESLGMTLDDVDEKFRYITGMSAAEFIKNACK